jgi:hypothetical protein
MEQLDRVELKVDNLAKEISELNIEVKQRLTKAETDIAWTKGSIKIIIPIIISIVGWFATKYI